MKRIFHTFAMALLAGGAAALAQDDIILEDGVFMDDTGMDPIFSTPSTLPPAPAAEGETARPILVPNDYYFEYMGRMHIHGQGQHARIMNAFATIPLINGRKHAWHGWHLDCKLSGRISWLHNSGTRVLDESRLYTLGLNATVLHQIGQKSQFHLGLTPQISTDFDTMSHDMFYWGGNVGFSSALSDNFKFTLGVSVMPHYNNMWFYPLVNFNWRVMPRWELQLQAERLSYQYVSGSEKFRVGPFLQYNRSVWTVNRHRKTCQFRMNNWIGGATASYRWNIGSCKVTLLGDLGFTFYNNFRIKTKNGKHTLDRYRAGGGPYARIAVGLEF